MRIDKLEINEFRGYENKTFSFNPHFNVLIGENGSGKTTVLEALAVAINSFIAVVEDRNMRPIRKEDIRSVAYEYSIEEKVNTYVRAQGVADNKEVSWETIKTHRDWGFRKGEDNTIRSFAKKAITELSRDGGKDTILPLFCYMGSGRLWTESTEKVKPFPKGSRLEGYYNALNAKGHFKRFVDWFRTMELSALQQNEQSKLNADLVRKTVSTCLGDGWNTFFYSIADEMLMAKKNENGNEKILPFHYLSDGQRNMMGIIADIAYRCILLNPYLREDCMQKTPGIVLIDEIDLHLHPNWQRTIVQKLKDAFPSIQFITTTHSPFIVQSLKNEELIDMNGKELDEDYWRKGIEDIAQNEMGVENPTRSEHFIKMKEVADQYYKLIIDTKKNPNDKQIKEVKEELDNLMKPFYDDPAYVAYLESFKHQLD